MEYTSWIVYAMVDTLLNQTKVLIHCIKHKQDSIKGNWESFGVTERTKEYYGQFNWFDRRNAKHVKKKSASSP